LHVQVFDRGDEARHSSRDDLATPASGGVMAEGAVIMKTNRKTMGAGRYEELRAILEERRLDLIGEVQDKMRDVRSEGAAASKQGARDEAESSDAEIQDDIEFALLQMKAETLTKINEALARLEEGSYGYCYECGGEIAKPRLRALPFAVRCRDCEEAREDESNRERGLAGRRGVGSLFADMIG